jgi:hypothetical protein
MAFSAEQSHAQPSIEHLLDEYSSWKSVLDRESDEFGAVSKLAALYRFAIANYSNPLAEVLLDAIAAMEASADEAQ